MKLHNFCPMNENVLKGTHKSVASTELLSAMTEASG